MGNGGRLNAGDTLALDFTGLPSRSSTPRYAVVGLAVVILAIGLFVAFTPGRSEELRAGAVAGKARAPHGRDRGPRAQAAPARADGRRGERRHQKLLSDLEHVLAELDSSPTPGDEGLAA